ncbi:GNAT family N-acetyltransferase [uncultured Parolsenella sp.]|uniref:GNAT family N-acetyltransferase n=1 Tax=uncultured Parolsenella sp. TaxID=2083008 RepID=UPI0025FE32D6|nr:GNAT family N-acetyltransferase [uncultured Parolsenella sp.]
MARTERLALRHPKDEDLPLFIDSFSGRYPLLAKEYRRSEELRLSYWEGVQGESSLHCSICARENGEFMGYCCVEDLNGQDAEVGINLLERFQARGFGPETIVAFMDAFQRVAGPSSFIAKIDPENLNSQKMFRRLGFLPGGIDTVFIKDPDMLRQFEEMRLGELGGVPERLRALAKEFGVEPRKLLSHALVFRKAAGGLR